MRLSRNRSSGFTLIELLTATFILLIIVLIIGKVYHQSSLSWSAGVRRAQGNMSGRSAIGYMARELMCAVADPEYLNSMSIVNGARDISFVTLAGEAAATKRVARRVRYLVTGGRLERQVQYASTTDYGEWGSTETSILATNVSDMSIYTEGGPYDYGALPEWVRISIYLQRQADVSGVGASSIGPDRKENTADDIKSW